MAGLALDVWRVAEAGDHWQYQYRDPLTGRWAVLGDVLGLVTDSDADGLAEGTGDIAYMASDRMAGRVAGTSVQFGLITLGGKGDRFVEVATPDPDNDHPALGPDAKEMTPVLTPTAARQAAKHLRELASFVERGVKGKRTSRHTRTIEVIAEMLGRDDKWQSSRNDRISEDLPLTLGDLHDLLVEAGHAPTGAVTRRRVVKGAGFDEKKTNYEGDSANLWMELSEDGQSVVVAAKEGRESFDIEDDYDSRYMTELGPDEARVMADKLESLANAADADISGRDGRQ